MTRAPISLPGRTVIFDYGEVISLTQSPADREAIRSLAEVDAEPFWRAYFGHRDGLDQGSDGVAAYWQAIAAEVGAEWDDARVHELWAADFRSWLSINPATIEVLADLKAGGTRLALLSNAGPDFGSYFRHGPLGDFFAACYVSGELNLLKPHPEIYQHVLGDLGVSARHRRVHRQPRGERAGRRGRGDHRTRVYRSGRTARLSHVAWLAALITRAEQWLFKTPGDAFGVQAVIAYNSRENAPAL